jgi:hypothetical protein
MREAPHGFLRAGLRRISVPSITVPAVIPAAGAGELRPDRRSHRNLAAMMSRVQLAFALGHPTPDAVRLGDTEGMFAALDEDGAALAQFLGSVLALAAGTSALAVRVEEH